MAGEPRHARDERIGAVGHAGPASSRSTTSTRIERPGCCVVIGGDLGLAGHEAVDHAARVDLAMRVRIAGADSGATVLEDEDVRDVVALLERCGSLPPLADDVVGLVIGEFAERRVGSW